MTESKNMEEEDIVREIMHVWGGFDDFGGRHSLDVEYIAWVIDQNTEEMREAETWTAVENELADIAICSLRALAELPDEQRRPEEIIQERLNDRMLGQQEDIIRTYKGEYADVDG